MKPVDVERFRKKLLNLHARLTDDIDRQVENIHQEIALPGEISKIQVHNADQDTEGLERDVLLEQTQEGILAQVDAALHRIESGIFGKCADCHCDISVERLEALPYTAYCVDCSRRHEDRGEDEQWRSRETHGRPP